MSHSHLTLEEGIRIELFVSMGPSCREMARGLGRSHSALARELRRNVGSAKRGYRAQNAERRAHKSRRRQAGYGQGRRLFSGRIDISYRPGIVELGTRFGDWEGVAPTKTRAGFCGSTFQEAAACTGSWKRWFRTPQNN